MVSDPDLNHAKQDWEILCEIAIRMGYEMSYEENHDIFKEIAAVPGVFPQVIEARSVGDKGGGAQLARIYDRRVICIFCKWHDWRKSCAKSPPVLR